ncbi:hypothetical protein RJ639_015521 [Escallonia herrerae]|uniref:Zinc finger, CCHC-type n=1 Tax=Escallonia herrerae TaxID=1293975 RepID=A0AA89ALD5_9ASTE|nr:hypothetical protein RJ639_015521 [Escallonia herrerae]
MALAVNSFPIITIAIHDQVQKQSQLKLARILFTLTQFLGGYFVEERKVVKDTKSRQQEEERQSREPLYTRSALSAMASSHSVVVFGLKELNRISQSSNTQCQSGAAVLFELGTGPEDEEAKREESHIEGNWKMKVYYVIVNPRPPEPDKNEEESVAQTRERLRWDQDDEICRGNILNGMSNTLFDAYHTVKTAKELWNQLERRYITEDATSKMFIVSKFFDYKMLDGRSVMEQFNEIKSILDRYSQHKLALDEFIVITSIIDKLPPSWKNFRNSLKHHKEDINLDELGTHLRIEEDLRKEEKSKSEERIAAMVEGVGASG